MGLNAQNRQYSYTDTEYDLNNWCYAAGELFDSHVTHNIYVNGALDNDNIGSQGTITQLGLSDYDAHVARQASTSSNYFNGKITELRLSNIDRGADWVNFTYNITMLQGSYVTIGSETISQSAPTQSGESPVNSNYLPARFLTQSSVQGGDSPLLLDRFW